MSKQENNPKNNPFDKQVFNRTKFEALKRRVDDAISDLDIFLPSALNSGLSVEQIAGIRTDDEFKAFIDDAKNSYIKAQKFIPMEERLRIAQTYSRVYNDHRRPVITVSSILNNPEIVVTYDEDGTPHIDREKTIEKGRAKCYDTINNEKLCRLYNALCALDKAILTFDDTLQIEGINIRHKGVSQMGDGGGIATVNLAAIAQLLGSTMPPLNLEDYANHLFWFEVRK